MGNLISTKQLAGRKVVDGKKHKRIGKVRRFVFHPTERRCIGFLVKRPDAALMFHRKDLFVALNGYDIEGGEVVVRDDSEATERGAIRALGVNWEKCVIWVGMPIVTESGSALGYVDTVTFDRTTGAVDSLTTEEGAANKAILGKRTIPAKLVRGFRANPGDVENPGVILVSDDVMDLPADGGMAAAAGKATAVATNKAKKTVAAAKPKAQKAAEKTGEAVNAGAFVAGKQLGRASGMFAAFKEEFDKAARGEDEED